MDTNNLIWLDLEFTSLDLKSSTIVEIATIITNSDLDIIAEGPNVVIHKEAEVIKTMDPWCIEQFGKTGLTKEIQESTVSLQEAEARTLAFLKKYTLPKTSPLCGNSIQHDRYLLMREMPKLERYFHYRHIDVSTVKELAKRWRSDIVKSVVKESTHRALPDIKESIEELKYYRSVFLK